MIYTCIATHDHNYVEPLVMVCTCIATHDHNYVEPLLMVCTCTCIATRDGMYSHSSWYVLHCIYYLNNDENMIFDHLVRATHVQCMYATITIVI